MIKKTFLLILVIVQSTMTLLAQKKLLTHSTPGTWPIIEDKDITDDGQYVKYSISIPDSGKRFFVQSVDRSWKKQLVGVSQSFFSNDSHRLSFMQGKDSLGIMDLGTDHIRYIPGVSGLSVPEEDNSPYIAYQRTDPGKTLVLLNLSTQREKSYPNVEEYIFNKNGKVVVFTTSDNLPGKNVVWLDLPTGKAITICSASEICELTFNGDGTAVAFSSKEQVGSQQVTTLYFYKAGMDSAGLINDSSPEMKGLSVKGNLYFSEHGQHLFFETMKVSEGQQRPTGSATNSNVSILLPGNIVLNAKQANSRYWATVDLNDVQKKVTLLQQSSDRGEYGWDNNGDWFFTQNNISGDPLYIKSDTLVRPDIYLVSTKTGARRLIKRRLYGCFIGFSPSGKYLIWFDQVQGQWYSHNIAVNKTKNITARISEPLYWENDYPDYPGPYEIGGWLGDDKRVLIYGRQDIWLVDPDGSRPPVNLTHGYGKKNAIEFRRLTQDRGTKRLIAAEDTLILSAFDLRTKQDGFFRLCLSNKKLEKLIMSPNLYTFNIGGTLSGAVKPQLVVKAGHAQVYLLSRMSAAEYPNLCTTNDFKDFKVVTKLAPQKGYNWYATELLHWKLPDGKQADGILYKPENFDPKKKYPVIFYYYEKNAGALNNFLNPELSRGLLDIPWFVSNGYLVCVPDIYYKNGYPGRSALNSVVSVAKYLSRKPWVDAKHMGLQGHSYGGFETNYIVSHSNLFAAAAPAAGLTDFVSNYQQMGIPWFFESRQGRMGATLWQRPDLYIENSPVFTANKVTAPILIMSTTSDYWRYSQSEEWYNDLHRLGKKVWMLSYGGENHTLEDPQNQLDYAIRLGQFFDYELKGLPPPKWMTTVTNPKKSDMGYELDTGDGKPE